MLNELKISCNSLECIIVIRQLYSNNFLNSILISLLFYFFYEFCFAASYSYNVVNAPVGFDSSAQAINDLNNIVGTHQNLSMEKSAWLYENGSYASLPSAGNCSTTFNGNSTVRNIDVVPLGINNSNVIVGQTNTCGK